MIAIPNINQYNQKIIKTKTNGRFLCSKGGRELVIKCMKAMRNVPRQKCPSKVHKTIKCKEKEGRLD